MVAYDPQTALIVVDYQNDFAHPQGSLYVRGAETLVEALNDEIQRAREGGALVVYSQDWHPQATPHFEKDGGAWPVHCVAGSWGAAFFDGLDVKGEIVKKGTGGEDGYSAFGVRDPVSGESRETGLNALLQSRGIRRLVVVGLATDYCVKETGLDGCRLGYEVIVLTRLIGGVDLQPGDSERALEALRRAGASVE